MFSIKAHEIVDLVCPCMYTGHRDVTSSAFINKPMLLPQLNQAITYIIGVFATGSQEMHVIESEL